MARHKSIMIGTIALSLLVLMPSGSAQSMTRNLNGTVMDAHHEPLKGAVIQVQNDVTTRVISYITGSNGQYSFKRLDGNTDYRFWANFRGQHSKVHKLSAFDSDEPKVVDLVIRPKH